MTREERFMNEAIALSALGVSSNQGGPFGCVIVQGDNIVGRAEAILSASEEALPWGRPPPMCGLASSSHRLAVSQLIWTAAEAALRACSLGRQG